MEPISIEEIVATELVEEAPVAEGTKYSEFINSLMSESMTEARAQIKNSILEHLGINRQGGEVRVSRYNSEEGGVFPQLVSNYCATYFDKLIEDLDVTLNKRHFREKLKESVECMADKHISECLHRLSREFSDSVMKDIHLDIQATFKPKILEKLKKQVRSDIAQRLGAEGFIEEESESEQSVQA